MSNVLLFPTVQSDELSLQKKLRTEVIQLEDTLAQVRKEYEMLRIEFEQNLAANEQAGTFLRWILFDALQGSHIRSVQSHYRKLRRHR